jgi:hypothetical protein
VGDSPRPGAASVIVRAIRYFGYDPPNLALFASTNYQTLGPFICNNRLIVNLLLN